MEESANEILTAIVHGMRRDEASNQVRLAATTALFNSLEFTNANFSRDDERNYIMQVRNYPTLNIYIGRLSFNPNRNVWKLFPLLSLYKCCYIR